MENVNNEEEDYPECPICLDIYGNNLEHIKAPKVLQCGDTFCKECLEDLIKRENEEIFNCPMCKVRIMRNQNIDNYITNKQIIKLVNSYFNLPKIEVENKAGSKKPISFRIITLGNSGVGKTSIFHRLSNDKFQENYGPTIGLDISKPYYIKYKKQKYKLFFYDTGGQEKNINITKNYLKLSDGILFVYDVSDEKSFYDLETWYNLYKNEKENVIGLLIGNKCDAVRKVKYEEAKKFAEHHGLVYIETSAKLDKGVKKALACLLNEIIESKANYVSISPEETNDKFQLDPQKLEEESFCSRFCKKLNPKNWFNNNKKEKLTNLEENTIQ